MLMIVTVEKELLKVEFHLIFTPTTPLLLLIRPLLKVFHSHVQNLCFLYFGILQPLWVVTHIHYYHMLLKALKFPDVAD